MTKHPKMKGRREEALDLLESLAAEICGDHDLGRSLRIYLLALRFLGWSDDWVTKELEGHPPDEYPAWRLVSAPSVWRNKKGENRGPSEMAGFCVRASVSDLTGYRTAGCLISTGKKSKGTYGEELEEWAKVDPHVVEMVLRRISEKLFSLVCDALASLKFGEAAESVFHEYQESVSQALSKLGIEDHLQNAYDNLQGTNRASWRACALACRNILLDLGRTLYQAPGTSYPYIEVEGRPMSVSRSKEMNRIQAYLHQRGIEPESLPTRMLKPLYEETCRGKSDVSYKQAQSFLINTYIFVGELARRTSMKPVTKLREPQPRPSD